MSHLIRLRGVTKIYEMGMEEVRALDGINLDIGAGEYAAIIGASGSGKSTLMHLLGCLDLPSEGQYLLHDRDVSSYSDKELANVRNLEIGFIFQNFSLLPRMNALQNVMQPLIYRGVSKKLRSERAMAALEKVGLGHRASHFPNELSGGQRQRVAIARALCTEPSLLIADEPTGNLDSKTASEIQDLFDNINDQGHTVIMVTHEVAIAARCKRTITISDGRITNDSLA
jgi:putative ABC transport system ATP-binding protein